MESPDSEALYSTQGGVAPKATLGLTWAYIAGCKGATGFSSKSTAAQVAANWDGKGQVAVVTGSSTGLGYESAKVLAARGCHVIATVRSQARADATAEELRRDVPGANVTGMALDLSDLTSVAAFAKRFIETGLPLSIIINNAGIMACAAGKTVDGFEMQWGTNHLGHFLLVKLLQPALLTTAQTSGREGRIINVSSIGHHLYEVPKGINFDALTSLDGYDLWKAYGVSKLSNILFTRELNDRLAGLPIAATCCHPGVILGTDLKRHMTSGKGGLATSVGLALARPLAKSIAAGAATQVMLAVAPKVVAGEYYNDCNIAPSSRAAHTRALGKQLWQYSEDSVSRFV